MSVKEKGRGSYRFGIRRSWAVGSFLDWAGKLPRGLSSFIYSFLIF
jgi:hypothetical protein